MNTTPVTSTPVPSPAAAGVLVSPAWLQARLHDPAVRVVEVDVGPERAAFNDWHIDGAVLWNIYADLRDAEYRPVPTLAVQRLLERSGIAPHTTVVFYGYGPAMGFWLMKLYGHADARILDCSRDTWRGEGGPASSMATEASAGQLPAWRPGRAAPSRPRRGARCHRQPRHHPAGRAHRGGVLRRTVLAVRRHGAGRGARPHPRSGAPADRWHV